MGLDHVTRHGGGAALAIASIDSSAALFHGVAQFIKADDYRGKRIKLSAWVRTQGVAGTDTGLWMRVDGATQYYAFDNFATRTLRGTSDWQLVSIILDVPNEALGIALGALMSARGEFFVDDMALEVVPDTGPTTNTLTAPVDVPGANFTALYANAPRSPSNLNFER